MNPGKRFYCPSSASSVRAPGAGFLLQNVEKYGKLNGIIALFIQANKKK